MEITKTGFGTWNGGRFMHFGEVLEEDRLRSLIESAYEQGVRTFLTADTYGTGKADELLGEALAGVDRSTYALVGMVGHDIYDGQRAGARGYARFTHPEIRSEDGYSEYLKRATEKSLERCRAESFDLVMLHNPDHIGYTHEGVWEGMSQLKDAGLTSKLGLAPGPANGFSIDIAYCLENFGAHIDWAMFILNPMEPWPTNRVLPIAQEFDVDVMTRVVDYGGLFHDDVKPGHHFRDGDHRTYRMAGWIEQGNEKLEKMRPIAEKYGLTMLQFSCVWNLSQSPVKCACPTLIQEAGQGARLVEEKLAELAGVPDIRFTEEEVQEIAAIGNNEGCMALKGASTRHEGMEPQPDHWPMTPSLEPVAARWMLDPSF